MPVLFTPVTQQSPTKFFKKNLLLTLLLCAMFMMVGACGNKGDLYMPEKQKAGQESTNDAQQDPEDSERLE